VANNQSCVDCHNRIFDSEIFKLDDVMGAFIVESDLSPHALRNLKYAIGAFFVALTGFLMLTSRERKRMKETVLGLRARVRLEKLKREAEEREVFLRSHDSLTGLPNRAMLMDRLDKDMVASKHAPVILALVDVDDFKLVNDELGHAAGDALLIEIANRLQHIAKSANGLAARLGGDEFAVTIEPSDEMASPNELGAALKSIFAENFQFEHNRIQPKCSIGISCTADIIGRSRSELLKAADSALYEAKAKGKNTFQVFNEEIKESIVRRDHLAAKLPTAIRNGEISVALQPKLCLETGTLAGFEALARWTCDGERIAPIEFVAIAETIGIIRELDLAVLKAAAEFSVGEKNRNGREVPISANICALHFRAGSLISDIERILNLTGLDPKLLTLEITESVVVENWDRALKTFEALRRWGIRVSLDDFGTGYSSLSYLRSLKFEEIKIDREFVVDIATNPDTKFIFDNIVNLAHGLGSTIVVEGIETEVQARIVKAANACVGQGYLFGRPFSVEQAKVFMSALDRMAA
ncbi:MAG: EAL domain-containing protein, partial [Pseudomonadota bacterium]